MHDLQSSAENSGSVQLWSNCFYRNVLAVLVLDWCIDQLLHVRLTSFDQLGPSSDGECWGDPW